MQADSGDPSYGIPGHACPPRDKADSGGPFSPQGPPPKKKGVVDPDAEVERASPLEFPGFVVVIRLIKYCYYRSATTDKEIKFYDEE